MGGGEPAHDGQVGELRAGFPGARIFWMGSPAMDPDEAADREQAGLFGPVASVA